MNDAAQASLERARALRTAKRPAEALDHLGPALADHHTLYEAFLVQASALADLGQTDDAIKAAKRAQAEDPLDEHAFRIEGLIRVNKLGGAGAERVLRESVRLAPNLHNRYVLVHALRGRRQQAEARSIATQLLAQFPYEAQAFDALAVVEMRARRWAQAEALARRSTDLEPHEPLYATRLGNVLQAQGKTESAADAYLAAARSDPTDTAHRRRLGRVGMPLGAAGLFAIGKLGLLPFITKSIVIVGGLNAANGGGDTQAAQLGALLFAVWAALMVLIGMRLGPQVFQLRRGVAVLPESVRPEIARDNRAAIGKELLGLGASTSLFALGLCFTIARLGLICLAISLTIAVLGWRSGPRRSIRLWVSGLWPPRLERVPLSLAIGSLGVGATGLWILIYAVVLPAMNAPPLWGVSALAFVAWFAAATFLVPLVASIRGVIQVSVSARRNVVTCAIAGLLLVVLLEGVTAWLYFAAQEPNRNATLGIVWTAATVASLFASPAFIAWARSVRDE